MGEKITSEPAPAPASEPVEGGPKVTIDEPIEQDPAAVLAAIEQLRAAGVQASPGKCLHFYGADLRCVFCRCVLP